MNDPSHDDEITNAADEADRKFAVSDKAKSKSDDKADDQQQQAFNFSAKWWYASTAFPLLAGTFGPMANAFSICALVQHWRVEVPPGGTEEHGIDIPDPSWLIAVNAVSLAFALIANLSLLLNMAKRLRFEIAQPITVLGFWIASVLLIALLSYASTSHFHAPGVKDQALTQAFYYAIFAAGLYQIISYLMCMTVYGAWYGYYSKDFQLNVAQRTLMLQTISFLVYLLLGALVYSKIENWEFLDTVFWADFTLLTIGLGGQYVPETHLGRGLLFPFAIGGIITIGLVVSSIRSLALERGAQKLSARMMEKTRRRAVKQILAAEKKRNASGKPLFGLPKSVANKLAEEPNDDKMHEIERRKTEFEAMRRVQEMAGRERKYISLLFSTTAFAILWFVGAALFWKCETNQGWTYFQALYFAYTSILTIGFGDFVPMSNSGKPFFVFWSLLAIPALTILISDMGDTVVKGIKDVTIWIGEISVLPSSDAPTSERLKRGVYRATLGKFSFADTGKDMEKSGEDDAIQDETDKEWDQVHEMHPGMIQLFSDKEQQKIDPKAVRTLHQLAEAWALSEEGDEDEARENKDKRAEAEHHYRHLLISQISKVYGETKLSTPKQYSYLEWGFYLKLLGEDESDASHHRKPHAKPKTQEHKHHHAKDDHKDAEPQTNESDHPQDPASKWSWIGQHSPLMSDKNEAEWILERLFERLEESFRALSKERQHMRERAADHHHSSASSDQSDTTRSSNPQVQE